MEEIFPGVFLEAQRLYTVNLTPGETVFGEKISLKEDIEYRSWNPFRSKISAALLKDLKNMPVKPGSTVLYLGAASGTTASHVSDIIGEQGVVYAVEKARDPFKKLLKVCENRENMVPLIMDASKPSQYMPFLEPVDLIYMDVAQRNQAEILLQNIHIYLKKGGSYMMALKAKSIDAARNMQSVVSEELKTLKKEKGLTLLEVLDLDPFEKDHVMVVGTKK